MSKDNESVKDTNITWDELERQQKLIKRIPNKAIKTKDPSDIVYSHADYAQDLYNLIEDSTSDLKFPLVGDVTEGRVVSINVDTAIIDINYRESAYLNLNRESKKYLEYIKPGNDIKVKILSDADNKGYIMASFTEAALKVKEDEIKESIGKSIAFNAKVEQLITTGGYILDVDDIKVFMPGSLAGVNKLYDFESMIGKEIYVMPVNYDERRGTIVVSHRKYLHTLIPNTVKKLKENIKDKIEGFVTGTTNYGVFCEFNDCLTGMIHVTDLETEMKDRHRQGNIKPGDDIKFYIKEIVNPKKIILTQKIKKDPWADIDERYKVPCVTKGKVMGVKDYGAFIELEEGIVGLLHHSQYDDRNLKAGQSADIIVNRIDKSTKKVFLSLKEESINI